MPRKRHTVGFKIVTLAACFVAACILSFIIEVLSVIFFRGNLVTGFIVAFALCLAGISLAMVVATAVQEIPFRGMVVAFLTVGSLAGFTGAVVGGESSISFFCCSLPFNPCSVFQGLPWSCTGNSMPS